MRLKNLMMSGGLALIVGVSVLTGGLLVTNRAGAGPSLATTDLTGALAPQDLANALVGAGITVSNVTYTGADVAGGTFSGGTGIIGFEEGIILSSGSIANVVGPNLSPGITGSNGTAGDADLTVLSGFPTFDAAVLEFDFVPQGEAISIRYVFASDEYNEYVNSAFNDTFAFFINGENCATVSGVPVAINTINNGNPFDTAPRSQPELYVNNEGGGINTEMDGLTVVLTCNSLVDAGETNHIKLAIADASDEALDSNVFLEISSFQVGGTDDKMTSRGKFQIVVREEFRPLMAGYPGYDGTSKLDSPDLYDPNTVVGRSPYHLDGDATDSGGASVGTAGTIISDSDFSLVPPGFEGPAGTREVHTEIRELNLTAGPIAVRAGTDAPDQPISPGEVESQSASGNPANDFPADSFFDVFVEVDLPAAASFPGGTLFNSDPLLVENTNVTILPPKVVYRHGNSSAVPLYFKSDHLPEWGAGDLFGWLTLAGHGAGFDDSPEDIAEFHQIYEDEVEPFPLPLPTKQPDPGDTDGDGCSDVLENGPDETLGGLRDWLNPHDFYDVLGGGGGPPDQFIDLTNDIFGVIQQYFHSCQ